MYHQIKCHISCFWYLGLSIEMPSLSVLVNGMRSVIIVKHIMDYGWWRLSQSDSEHCVSIRSFYISFDNTSEPRHMSRARHARHKTYTGKVVQEMGGQHRLMKYFVDTSKIISWNPLPARAGLGWSRVMSALHAAMSCPGLWISPPTSHYSRRPPKAWED